MGNATILVIGVSDSDLSRISESLAAYRILAACDVTQAYGMLERQQTIQIVIIDLDMPDSRGMQLLAMVKSEPRFSSTHVIILTRSDDPDQEISGLRLGADDYLRKPILKETLRARIDMHFELAKQKVLEQQLKDQGQLFNAIFQQAPIGITISHDSEPRSDGSDDLFDVNPLFERITGRSKDELISLGWLNITHPDDRARDLQYYMQLQEGQIPSYEMEKRYLRPDGSSVWVQMIVAPLKVSGTKSFNHICLVQDISKRKEIEQTLAESERSKSVLLAHLPGMAYRCNYDHDWTMQFVSEGCHELTGYASDELLQNRSISYNELIAPEYRDYLWQKWELTLSHREQFRSEYEIITARGIRKWVLELGQGIFNGQGEIDALEGIILDISEQKRVEDELTYHTEHEIWTGLYNRRYFESLLRHDAIVFNEGSRAVISVNLSSVQILSMSYGFQYSQDIIRRAADALKELCSTSVQLFNTYESRFVFYVKGYAGRAQLHALCTKVNDMLASLLAIERIGWGIGVIEIDDWNKHDVDLLLKNLLIASEKSLANFEQDIGIVYFDKVMEKQIAREEEITSELFRIADGEAPGNLFLHYQPIIDLASDTICGFEALARMRSEALGNVPPLEFIPIAEKTKLIIPLGEMIILQAFRFLNELAVHGHGSVAVSINISALQLLHIGFVDKLFTMIHDTKVDPRNVSLEITESILVSNYQEINRVLGQIQHLGIQIALDDFGTGYSSLSRERELNVSCIKIDKYFIDKLLILSHEESITGDIISMAHKMGHCVVAEGIEHERQMHYLRMFGCDKIQGYLISKPVGSREALKLLGDQKCDT